MLCSSCAGLCRWWIFMVEIFHGHEGRGLVKTFSWRKLSTFDISPLLMLQSQTAAQTSHCCVELHLCCHCVLCKCWCNLQKTPFSLLSRALVCVGDPLSVLMRLPQYKNSSTDSISFLLILIKDRKTVLVLLTNRTFVSQTEIMWEHFEDYLLFLRWVQLDVGMGSTIFLLKGLMLIAINPGNYKRNRQGNRFI